MSERAKLIFALLVLVCGLIFIAWAYLAAPCESFRYSSLSATPVRCIAYFAEDGIR